MSLPDKIIQIGLSGASGKMGQAIKQKIKLSDKYNIVAGFTSKNDIEDLSEFCKKSDIILDFSNPTILNKLLQYCVSYKKNIVIGTTGLLLENYSDIEEAAKNIAVLYSPNMSVGINLAKSLASQLGAILDENYDIEIIDNHHRLKKDAPSGTAIMLGKAIAQAKNLKFEELAVFDRHSKKERKSNEIGFSVIRAGDNYGEHEIIFAGNNEIITIKHQALSRDIFALGALKAASWLVDKNPGLYSMKDVLNISSRLDL